MNTGDLHKELREWVERVLIAFEHHHYEGQNVTTRQMMVDVDKIIAEAFDRDYCFEENK